MNSGNNCRGATLLEILIALVILSFGILGQAGLQSAALRANHGALMRSQATSLGYEILDRMRANAVVARAGGYNITFFAAPAGADMAAQDLLAWKTRLANMLRDGDGAICTVANANSNVCVAGGDFILVQVQWVETDDSNQNRVLRAPVTVMGQL